MEEELELLKKDLSWQLTFEEMDWDYFRDTVNTAVRIQKNIFKKKDCYGIRLETS